MSNVDPGRGFPQAGAFGQPNAVRPSAQPGAMPMNQAGFGQPAAAPVNQAGFGQPAAAPMQGQAGFGQPAAAPVNQAGFGQPAAAPMNQAGFGQPVVTPYAQPGAAQPFGSQNPPPQFSQPYVQKFARPAAQASPAQPSPAFTAGASQQTPYPGAAAQPPQAFTAGIPQQTAYPTGTVPPPAGMGAATVPPAQEGPEQAFDENRGGFGYIPTGRGPSLPMRWWHWAVIGAGVLVLAAVVLYAVLPSLMPNRDGTAVIRQASLGEQYSGDALVVRNETVYDQEGVTRVEYVAEEGQVVRYNAEICRVFASGYSTRDMESLQTYRDQIRTYQRALLTSETTIEGQRYAMESNVLQSIRQIRDIIGGARGNLINQEQILTGAVRERQTYIRNTYVNDQRLTRLLEDANVQEQKIDSVTRRYKATEECIVSFYVDGFEYGLTMNNYNTFEPMQVRAMASGQKPELTASQRGKTAIYRTVRDGTWAVLMLVDDQTWNPVEGQQFQMRLETFAEDQVAIARVESFRRSGGELLVILTVESGVRSVLDLRQSRVELYSENTALIVPSRAVYVQDEMEGVVVRSSGGDVFVPIIVIRRSGDDVYISPVTEGFLFEGLTVRLF